MRICVNVRTNSYEDFQDCFGMERRHDLAQIIDIVDQSVKKNNIFRDGR